jgi:hypothetical protein
MPIEEAEWTSISVLVEQEVGRLVGRRRDYFMISIVMKRDEINNLVWVPEFGPTPIPLFCFDYEVAYYDTIAGGGPPFSFNTVHKKFAKVRPLCPKLGETVLIAREMGADRLPRCLGTLRSLNFIIDENEEDD